MKVTLNWLREYVDINLPPVEIANRLTMAGLEVEAIQTIGAHWENIVVGQIINVNPHPNADRLRLATVDLGTGQDTVVCGAPNLKSGDKVVFAHVGAELIDGHTGQLSRLKPAKIRGVPSSGMICSEKELGISDSHEGIMVLPREAPLGAPLTDYLGDVIFDLAITPNRPDCLSVIGIAREVAALTGQNVNLAEISYEEAAASIDGQVSVEILDTDLCPRYCASLVTGIKVGESPPWLQQRLLACGMRPISNIVDITNYVMLEYGQPLHAFDYDLIRGQRIVVRRAKEGEVIVSLDGVERVLSSSMLVIADAERAVAIAGVMGGANSEVAPETTSILLEAASFNPASIRYTGGSLRLSSEASVRFERGISPELTLPALRRATQLIIQLAGGQVAKGLVDEYPGRQEGRPVFLPTTELKRVLGVDLDSDQVLGALCSLGFVCLPEASGLWAKTPYWRSDIRETVDLIEEVIRIIGYDKIPTTMLRGSLPKQSPDPMLGLKQKTAQVLAGYGFYELVSYSLASMEMLTRLSPEARSPEPVRLANPMTHEQEYLRPNLRANLLAAIKSNRRHEEAGLRFFELGKVYLPRSRDLPDEPVMLCGVLSGARLEKSWWGQMKEPDFYEVKGVVEGLLGQLGIEASFETSRDEGLHPSRQAAIVIGGERLGVVGEVHPKALAAFDVTETVYLFEINLNALSLLSLGHKRFQPIPRFPSVVRELALVVDAAVTHQVIEGIIRGFSLVAEVGVFDVYTGEPVPSGKKSVAYRVVFQSATHTLTDEEVNQVQQRILDKLSQELGAALRS